jgi:hypothetical protein
MVWAAGVVVAAIVLVTGCSQMGARMDKAASATGVTLTGAQEVPPVNTRASGVSSIVVIGDKTVSGSVQTTNLNATGAANPGGEIRLQLKP